MKTLVIPTARATFAVDIADKRATDAKALLASLGAEVFGPENLVMNDDDIAAAQPFVEEPTDLIIHVCASFCDAAPAQRLYANVNQPILLWSFREPGVAGDKLWLNSLCGANLIAHALVRDGKEVRVVYGDPDDPAVAETLKAALAGELPEAYPLPGSDGERASEAEVDEFIAALGGQTIGIIGEAPTGFTPSQYDPEVLAGLGFTVEKLDLQALFAEITAVPAETRAEELASAEAWQPSLKELNPEHVDKFAAVTTALREWRTNTNAAALAVRCWPEFPTELGVCPCSALSRLADEDTATQCERDVYGAATMLLLKTLGAGMTYLVDTVDLDAERNLVRFWHCGSAATKLAADPKNATQYIHANRKIGVAGNFPLKTGPVIAVRLTEDPGKPGLRMLIASGESITAPNRFQGNTADVIMDCNADTFVRSLVTGGFPHHTVLSWVDVRPQLRAIADRLNIPVVEF